MTTSHNKVCVTLLIIFSIGINTTAFQSVNEQLLNQSMTRVLEQNQVLEDKNAKNDLHTVLDFTCSIVYVKACDSIDSLLGFNRSY